MRILIVYESMFGSTRRVAEAVARGAAEHAEGVTPGSTDHTEVAVREVNDVRPDELRTADVLVVGAPTHAHGMSNRETRAQARQWSLDPARGLHLEPGAGGIGAREFLEHLDAPPRLAATFDTRASVPEIFSGSAARRAAHRLRKLGVTLVVEPQSFLVDSESRVLDEEIEHARRFGGALAAATAGLLHTAA